MSVIPIDPAQRVVMDAAAALAQPPQITTEVAHEALTPQFAWTANTLAGKAAMATSAAEAKDFADAALKMVQAVVTLDPERLQGGDTADARKRSVPDRPEAPKAKAPSVKDGDHDGRIGER